MRERSLLILCTLVVLTACGSEPDTERPSGDRTAARPGSAGTPSVTTEYTTNVLFLPFEAATTRAFVLDLANVATSSSLRHHYLGWRLTGQGWQSILDAEEEDIPLREPWRLFPVDSLRLTVTADGDPDALIVQANRNEYILEFGEHLDRWEDRAGTRHDIREAYWAQRGENIAGIAVQHRYAIPEPEHPARFGPYERIILRSQDGAIIVLFASRAPETYGDSYAWMYADGLTRRWTAVETRTVEVANSTQLRRNVPIRTWFRIPEPDIKGELTATERLFDEFTVDQGPKPYNALYRVRGWIEFAGERRNVEGLLERGEP
jgi:hypothetical protein